MTAWLPFTRPAERLSKRLLDGVLEEAAEGTLEITSLAEESRPPAHASGEAH